MIIEFNVGNYRSFNEIVTLSMVSANITAKNKELDKYNRFDIGGKLKLLKSAAIYGANASGKSNLIKAISFMRNFVLNSIKETSVDTIDTEPFRLSTETESEPSYFEMIFFLNGIRYRYGFEANREKVCSEWLYHTKVRESKLFEREEGKVTMSKIFRKEGKGLFEKTRDNALFLSVVDQFSKNSISNTVLKWFKEIGLISGLDDTGHRMFTFDQIATGKKLGADIIAFVKQMDLDIQDLRVKKATLSEDNLPENMPQELKKLLLKGISVGYEVTTLHKKYDADLRQVGMEQFNLKINESEGTQKLVSLAGPLLHTLQEGRILIIDELDARLHPLITHAIISLFNSSANHNNAQLIFATHDTSLLSNQLFRRDQIWFTEKDKYETTDLYSLAEYHKIRNDALFDNDYITGRYGAIPFPSNTEYLIEDMNI